MTGRTHAIPTFDQVMAEQSDLSSLCADRQLTTKEIFSPNAYYGFDLVLKAYADAPRDSPLKLVVPHGIDLNADHVWSAEVAAPLPAIVCAPREVRKYTEGTGKVVVKGATPFIYLVDLLGSQVPGTRAGTLFFLSHSTHRVTAISDFEALAERLARLPAKFHPVRVCIYWRDLHLNHHLPFKQRGMQIVSAGHMFDPYFLFRLYYLCIAHRYACSNELGSHLFYSVKAGCAYFHMGANARYVVEAEDSHDIATIPSNVKQSLERAFGEPHDATTAEQLAIVDEYVGQAHKLSPDHMRELLKFCESLDRFGTGAWQAQRYFTAPRLLQRWLWQKPNQLLRSAVRPLRKHVMNPSSP